MAKTKPREREKVFLLSLGCAKNLVDSEHMLGILRARGFPLTSTLEQAEIVVINTCGFLESASQEAVDAIIEAARLKAEGKIGKIVVTGCLVQRYGYELEREIPEVDGWLGTGEIRRVADILSQPSSSPRFFLGRPSFLPDHQTPRVQTTPFYTAYLRIAEGCSHKCTYCIIPKLRGPLRSRRLESLVTEAEAMARKGVREINLVAQDTSLYGIDLYGEPRLEDLLESLAQIVGIRWIRTLYLHPRRVSDRLLDLLTSGETICPYLDLPFQHVNPAILKAMGRGHTGETPMELMDRIRRGNREISVRTTLIVGFPGETEEIFGELCDFVMEARFDHLGAFVFSPEKGTPAARLGPGVDPETARSRLDTLMTIQAGISEEKNRRKIGSRLPVLIEGPSPETDLLLTGRTATMAPDVDTRVLINEGEGIMGEIMDVEITEAHPYDLVGRIVGR